MSPRIRRARRSDRAAMLDISRTIWEGHDYIPSVWDRWLRDPNGVVLVAEAKGRAVGLQHAVLHPDGSTWLEGIRVAPEARGQGVAGALLGAGIQWARDSGSPAVRLSTASDNPASNRLVEKAGFSAVERFRPLRGPAINGPTSASLAHPADFDAVWRALQGAQYYTEAWTAYRITPPRIALLLSQHCVVVAGSGVVIASATRRWSAPRIGLAVGQPDDVADAVRLVQSRGAALGLTEIRATIAHDAETVNVLAQLGFAGGDGWEEAMLLHELPLND
ncbi:MAG TPA: GNAT family N-acetyltransferase [Chloroflexota bacterium]|nr:GNAT family N-acetyltransferase [Chloroflexota bacterium]